MRDASTNLLRPGLAIARAAIAATLLVVACALAVLSGCAAPAGPAAPAPAQVAPAQPIADFSGARRCMDNLMVDYGTRDLSVIVEDASASARAGDNGTKALLVAFVT